MFATTTTCAHEAVDTYLVRVEARLTFGLPRLDLVGLPDTAAREGKDRVRAAIRATLEDWKLKRCLVNLSPAARRKTGSAFDLSVAMAIVAAEGECPAEPLTDTAFIGELGLDGALRAVAGSLPAALACARRGIKRLIVPVANAEEAGIASGIEIYPACSLREAIDLVSGGFKAEPARVDVSALLAAARDSGGLDLSEVKGLLQAKRVIEIAAAGGHHLLMIGPPGSGKTMLARRLPGIMPPLSLQEAIEATCIHSIAGIGSHGPLMLARPFRAPHHTSTGAAMVGGGVVPKPGEVSLSHHGILFLDELPQFSRHVLDQLREPLEDRMLTVSRSGAKLTFPASFLLVAAMNPCPCGFYATGVRPCSCPESMLLRHRSRISGPLLDRIDLHVEVPHIKYTELTSSPPAEDSQSVRERVSAARERRAQRDGAALELCDGAHRLLEQAVTKLRLSTRSTRRVAAVAATIADLAAASAVEAAHVAEALQYRPKLDDGLPGLR